MTDPALYLAGLSALLTARYLYSLAGAPQLRWLLAPTAWLVRLFGRIPFLWDPRLGYISHPFRFILAPSCSGFQFMLIAAATLFFTFIHRMETKKEKLGWTLSSLMVSYLFTIFINSLRVILAVYLPLLFEGTGVFQTWLTKEHFHTVIGVLVYFPALLLLYQMARAYVEPRHPSGLTEPLTKCPMPPHPLADLLRRHIPPVFWYLFMVLGLPFLHQVHKLSGSAFWSYALLVTILCLAVLLLLGAVLCVQRCYLPPAEPRTVLPAKDPHSAAHHPPTDAQAPLAGQQKT